MTVLYKNQVFKLYELLKKIIHDRGLQFNAKFMRELYKVLYIEGNPSTAYHSQTNSQTECINQEIEQYLYLYVDYKQSDWAEWLAMAEFAYNNREHSATKFSLFYVNYGRHSEGFGSISTTNSTYSVEQ